MKGRLLIVLTLTFMSIHAQTTFKKHIIKSGNVEIINPRDAKYDYNPILINLEAPSPDGDSYRSFLMRQKIKLRELYPQKPGEKSANKITAAQPAVGTGVQIHQVFNNGVVSSISMGIPNDNTLAVSNNGIVLVATNSIVWAYNSNTNSIHFSDQYKFLNSIGGNSGNDSQFDPKLIYDEDADRFILVYLQNNNPNTSKIRVCFSSTNDPEDPWYSYILPGNPLSNDRWTDFPAITITDDELFLTANLIDGDAPSWQLGFDGSIIWQMDKEKGFAGDSVLTNTLWTDIRHNGKYTRNLHPVCGIESAAPKAFFLSNRNFDLSNDTIFVLQITGNQYDPNTTLTVKSVTTSPNYGMPPNGRQTDTDINDPTSGLQTNDARVLGAITNGEWIQYVANTVNPATGFSGIYHGFITNPEGNTKIKGNIIAHPTRDYGYPNIAWTGDQNCDFETMIGFDYTSPTEYPGIGVIYFGNDSTYSEPIDLKKGENYINRLSGTYERWGDYFGIQRKYNEGKTVWLAGYYGDPNRKNQTWISQVFSPDSSMLKINYAQSGNPLFCNAQIEINPVGGVPPYQYSFNGSPFSSQNMASGLCGGTNYFTIIDSKGCSVQDSIILDKVIADKQPAAFPNPFINQMVVQFNLPQDQNLTIYISDMAGNVVSKLLDRPALSGQNELIFSLAPLSIGQYILKIDGSSGFSMTEKILKIAN